MGRSSAEAADGLAAPCEDQAIWDAYNLFLGGPDTERLRKLITRYELFRRTIELPGDVVEAGVLKGTGLLMWLKLLAIRCPGSMKRVVGFDLFEGWGSRVSASDKSAVEAYLAEAGFTGVTPERIAGLAAAAGFEADACELVAGDIVATAPAYVAANPGFRVSLLNLDMDLGEPTYAALEALWPRVVPGGVVILDEYAVPHWSASDGVDRWLAGRNLRLRTLPWGRSPTAYLIKP